MLTYFVIHANARNSSGHSTHIPSCDGVSEHEQREGDDAYPFCGIGHRVADGRDGRDHAKSNNVLAKVEQTIERNDQG